MGIPGWSTGHSSVRVLPSPSSKTICRAGQKVRGVVVESTHSTAVVRASQEAAREGRVA